MKRSTKQPSNATKKLTIGLVIDDSLDRPDGVQQYVLTLGAWLSGRGHDVHYIASETSRDDLPNLHVLGRSLHVRFNGNRLRTPLPASSKAIRELLQQQKFDILHVQMPYSPMLAGKVLHAAKNYLGTAKLATFHIFPDSELVRIGSKLLAATQRRQYRLFDKIISVSSAALQFAHETFGVTSDIVPNGVALEQFTHAASRKRPESPFTIVFLGRLVERKGCRELIEAVAAARDSLPADFRLRIGGRGPLLDSLKRRTTELGITEHVTFEGFIAETDKADFLADSDMILLPSTGGESFGISVVEALAASRGVVLAGNNAGYASVMHGLRDQLVDARDATGDFAAKIRRYSNMTIAERSQLADKQRQYAEQFSIEHVGARIEATYRDALRRRCK